MGIKGVYVKLEDIIVGFKMICDGELDYVFEFYFFYKVIVEDVVVVYEQDQKNQMVMYLEIVIVEGIKFLDEVMEIMVFGVMGELGILENYIFVLIVLDIGMFIVKISMGVQLLVVSGGFFEVDNNWLIVIIEMVELKGEIDIECVQVVIDKVKKYFVDLEIGSVDYQICF